MKRRAMDPVWKYVACAYLSFWAIILLFGGMASIVFGAPVGVMSAISILGSWSPTAVLLLMLKRLKPGLTVAHEMTTGLESVQIQTRRALSPILHASQN